MNNRQSYPSLEASYLAEGTQEITNTREPINCWESSSIVHSDLVVKGHSAEEGPQIGVEHEGRDDIDSQDAAMTVEETRTCPNVQTVPYVSSNYASARCENTTEVI